MTTERIMKFFSDYSKRIFVKDYEQLEEYAKEYNNKIYCIMEFLKSVEFQYKKEDITEYYFNRYFGVEISLHLYPAFDINEFLDYAIYDSLEFKQDFYHTMNEV